MKTFAIAAIATLAAAAPIVDMSQEPGKMISKRQGGTRCSVHGFELFVLTKLTDLGQLLGGLGGASGAGGKNSSGAAGGLGALLGGGG